MEAAAVTGPEFWESDEPVLMGHRGEVPAGVPGLVYFKTSGSTGEPKWIGLSRTSLMASAAAVNAHLEVGAESCWVLVLPVHHVGGFGVVARSRQAGCRMTRFEGKWDAEGFTGWLAEAGGTHLSLVPTQVHDLVAAGLRAPAGLRATVVGGGQLPEATGRAARDLGWPVLASYGMTEAASQIATQGLQLLESSYLTDPIELLPCWDASAGEDGRLMISGPALFRGILRQGAEGWKYEEHRGKWFTTSDIGTVKGRELWIEGRADTRVKILGELVDPVAVEAELLALAGASPGSAVVVAIEDARAGHKLILVYENGVNAARWAKVMRDYNEACEGYRRIGGMLEVESIPKSELGKPQRAALSRFAAGHAI
jgi:O-succinylbenzoic acid--CoA ligase